MGIWPLHCKSTRQNYPLHIIWSESTKWSLSFDIRMIPGALIVPMDTPIWSDGQIILTLHSYRPIHFLRTWFKVERIRPMVGELRCPQASKSRTDGRTDWQRNGVHSIVPHFPSERAGSNKTRGNMELFSFKLYMMCDKILVVFIANFGYKIYLYMAIKLWLIKHIPYTYTGHGFVFTASRKYPVPSAKIYFQVISIIRRWKTA